MSPSERKSTCGSPAAAAVATGQRPVTAPDADLTRLQREVDRLRADLSETTRRSAEEQDAERQSIARELHDNFGQFLTVLDMELGAIIGTPDAPAALRERVSTLKTLTHKAHGDLDRIAGDIRLPSLDSNGLRDACAQLLDGWRKRSSLTFDLHVALPAAGMPATVANVLYRVLQEAITNVARHARATHVGVILQARPHEMQMIVEDDGIGFELIEPDVAATPRFGLRGMRERLALVGGTLEIESARAKGTTLLVHVPL